MVRWLLGQQRLLQGLFLCEIHFSLVQVPTPEFSFDRWALFEFSLLRSLESWDIVLNSSLCQDLDVGRVSLVVSILADLVHSRRLPLCNCWLNMGVCNLAVADDLWDIRSRHCSTFDTVLPERSLDLLHVHWSASGHRVGHPEEGGTALELVSHHALMLLRAFFLFRLNRFD